jgi:hypothetical protein
MLGINQQEQMETTMYSTTLKFSFLISVILFTGLILPKTTKAHCDRVNGPVAVAAKKALATANVDKVHIWVTQEQEGELEATYRQAMKVYGQGGDSKELAERYFMENAVRLHRLAEGMPYTGLKPAQPEPQAIQTAEQALETGDLKPATDLLISEMKEKASHLFEQAVEAQKNKDASVTAGRKWTDAYVKYVIYIQGLYTTIQAGPAHGVGE